ncbi:LytR/AlgR family response regulator transcription factor [Actinomycetes bacterium NPDC127524]
MLKALITDDEPLARDELKYLLLQTEQVEVIGEAGTIDEALKKAEALTPDLVFIDIELSGESGITLAEKLKKMDPAPAIVFATAYDEYALQAFDLDAADYLLKPFDENRIKKTINKILGIKTIGSYTETNKPKLTAEKAGKLAIMTAEKIVMADIDSIIYLGTDNGTIIKTLNMEYKVSEPLIILEKKLSQPYFVRVHRSYLVNMNHIKEIEPWFNSTYNLIMSDKSRIPVSRTYVKELKSLLGF